MAPTPSIDEKDKTRGAVASPLGVRVLWIKRPQAQLKHSIYSMAHPTLEGRWPASQRCWLWSQELKDGKDSLPTSPCPSSLCSSCPSLLPSFHLFFLPYLLECLLRARNARNGYKHASCPPRAPMFTHNGLIFIPI